MKPIRWCLIAVLLLSYAGPRPEASRPACRRASVFSQEALALHPLWLRTTEAIHPLHYSILYCQNLLRWFSFPMGPKPIHISALDPVRDILEWREVQYRYAQFYKKHGLDSSATHNVLMPPKGNPKIIIEMCYPRHFTVPWSINAHMHPETERVDRILAVEQWEYLVKRLLSYGVQINLVEQHSYAADMVFVANGGVVDGKHFVPPHFAKFVRRGETRLLKNYFASLGYQIEDIAKGSLWEGEGDTLVHEDLRYGITRFGGYGAPEDGFRSNVVAQKAIADHLGQQFVGLELVDPHYYHLDTCLLPLGDGGSALYYPGAFTLESQELIRHHISNPIPISKEDASDFACNGITVGRTVFINHASPQLKRALTRAGYTLEETPTTEFLKSGGSVKCLILLLSGWLRYEGLTSFIKWSQAAPHPNGHHLSGTATLTVYPDGTLPKTQRVNESA